MPNDALVNVVFKAQQDNSAKAKVTGFCESRVNGSQYHFNISRKKKNLETRI